MLASPTVPAPRPAPLLTHLAIRDFTIVHRLDVEFGAGLTVLTGETGAGKSILVDALGFALGGRASAEMIRPGAERAEAAAAFARDGLPWLGEVRDSLGVEPDGDECILRRRISRDGRSRAWIDDCPVSAKTLRELGARLVDLQGQHAHHALLRPAHQRRVLDAAAGHADLLARTAELHRRTAALEAELHAARSVDGADRESRIDYLRFQCDELAALAVEPGEPAELAAQRQRLAHAVELRSAADEIDDVLSGEGRSADSAVHLALARLAEVERRAPGSTGAARELLETALVHVAEAAASVRAFARDVEPDPERLARVEHRLAALHDAARKHRASPDELPQRLSALREEMEGLESGEERIRGIEEAHASAKALYEEAAERLSAGRTAAAGRLADEVTRRIRELGVGAGEFSIAVGPAREALASGIDDVEFRVRINPGHPPTPFARTASGGEQSRISLGILVTAREGLPVMVFDEIDAGVGGRVAELVGRHLRRLAESRQVLCVTHLPQVASQAHGHLTVSKGANGSMTSVRVRRVNGEERTEEIARMLAGEQVTARSLAHAREMLEGAREEAGILR